MTSTHSLNVLNFAEFIFLKQVNPFHAQCPSGTAFYNQVQPIKGREGVNVSGLGVRRCVCVCGGGGGGEWGKRRRVVNLCNPGRIPPSNPICMYTVAA